MEMTKVQKSVAPDGGWGWYIVLGYSLNNMVVVPLIQVFGLLYRDLFLLELKMTNLEINTIIATNCSFGMLLAIFNGPVLRTYGYRKVAILGGILIFIGNIFTSQATTFWEFIIFFSIFVSYGMNLVMSAFNLALNTYFVVKRGVATGIAMSITGIGPIVMPQIVSILITGYGIRGSGMILSAIALHSLVAAMLLQPIKWHKIRERSDKIALNKIEENNVKVPEENPKSNENCSSDLDEEATPATKLMEAEEVATEVKIKVEAKVDYDDEDKSPPLKSLDDVVKKHKLPIWERIVHFFDFDLLGDPIYVNIAFGLSLAFVGEMNFSLMLPFILKYRGFDTKDTAMLMSLLALADIVSRFISPFIGQSIKSKVRLVYLFSLCCGIFFRICLIYSHSYFSVNIVIFGLGLTKGIRSVYTALVIPTYVPLRKLASATGLQMVINGLLYLIFGPLMGILGDTGDSNLFITFINCLTLCTICMWFTELMLIRKRKNKQKTPIVIKSER